MNNDYSTAELWECYRNLHVKGVTVPKKKLTAMEKREKKIKIQKSLEEYNEQKMRRAQKAEERRLRKIEREVERIKREAERQQALKLKKTLEQQENEYQRSVVVPQLQMEYGEGADLIEVVVRGVVKYKFVNVPPIKNYPFAFQSVKKAMNCLKLHESGYIGWKKRQKQDLFP